MAEKDTLSHDNFQQRSEGLKNYSENIAAIYSTAPLEPNELAQKIYDQWMGKKENQTSLSNDYITDIGVAIIAKKKSDQIVYYITQLMISTLS